MLISLVGPSRAGKTTLLDMVRPELPNVEVLSLDEAERNALAAITAADERIGGWEQRWERSQTLLQEADRALDLVVVDVGAGSLETPAARQFFIDRRARAIAILPPFEVLQTRHPGRDTDELRRTEYSPERSAVYDAAAHRVDSSRDLQSSADDLLAAMREIMAAAANL